MLLPRASFNISRVFDLHPRKHSLLDQTYDEIEFCYPKPTQFPVQKHPKISIKADKKTNKNVFNSQQISENYKFDKNLIFNFSSQINNRLGADKRQ